MSTLTFFPKYPTYQETNVNDSLALPVAKTPSSIAAESIFFKKPKLTPPPRSLLGRICVKIFRKKSTFVKKVEMLAKSQGIDYKNDKIKKTINDALKCIDYPSLKKDLKLIVSKLSLEEKEQLLKEMLIIDFENEEKVLGNRCVNLLSLADLRLMAKNISSDFKDVETLARKFDATFDKIQEVCFTNNSPANQKKTFALFKVIGNFFHTIAVAFKLLNLGKEPNTYFETKYMLDIYWLLLDVPLKIIKFVFNLFLSPLKSLVVITLGTTITTIAGMIISRLSKKVPNSLPECENLIDKIKRKKTIAAGREKEVESIIQALNAQNDISRKHPMILGKKGVGKTTLMDQLATRFANNDVPESLQGKKLFYLNAGELKDKCSVFDLRSPIKKIIDKIGKHKGRVVLIIDEAHNLTGNLGEQFKSLLDTSSKSLPFVIGITTPSEYQKCIQTNANMEDPENTLARRFKIVKIEEPDEKETRRILSRVVSAEFKDVRVKKTVLKYIFTETSDKVKDLNQPDKSVYFLSQAISKLKSVQSAQDLVALKQNALSKNASNIERLNKLLSDARSFQSDKVKLLEKKIEAKGKKIAELESQIENRKEIYLKYQRLTDLRAWHQNWLASTSKKISRESKLNKKTPEFLEKSYLFNSFFILHVLKEYMANFKREYAFTTSLTKEMVNESINDYLKNIGNAL